MSATITRNEILSIILTVAIAFSGFAMVGVANAEEAPVDASKHLNRAAAIQKIIEG